MAGTVKELKPHLSLATNASGRRRSRLHVVTNNPAHRQQSSKKRAHGESFHLWISLLPKGYYITIGKLRQGPQWRVFPSYRMYSFAIVLLSYPSSTCTTRTFFSVTGESCPMGMYTIVRPNRLAILRKIDRGGLAAT